MEDGEQSPQTSQPPNIARIVIHENAIKFLLCHKASGGFDKIEDGTVVKSFIDNTFLVQADSAIRSILFRIKSDVKVPDDFSVVELSNYEDLNRIALINGTPIFQKNTPVNAGKITVQFYTIDSTSKTLYKSSRDATSPNG